MRVALAPQYRSWMLALLPATLGVGTAALWFRARNWPLDVDEVGLRLRSQRHVSWSSINKIGVSRSYLDGHVSLMCIHHACGVSKVPVRGLKDGQEVVKTILATFERIKGSRSANGDAVAKRARLCSAERGRRTMAPRCNAPPKTEYSPRHVEARSRCCSVGHR
jgi:hypothetical protein